MKWIRSFLCLLLLPLGPLSPSSEAAADGPGTGELFRSPTGPPRVPEYPHGFQETTVFSALTMPTVVTFAKDGRVFVGEKSGLIKVFDGLNDPTPDVFADLRPNVHDYWDRGLLGLALDPGFPSKPYVYVLYTLDAPIGQTPPVYFDDCPDPLGDGCLVGARLSRLEANGNIWTGVEQVLIEGWCQQFPSHSIGTLAFGPDGALYVGGGDGGSFITVDYGQLGTPPNACGDPIGSNPPFTAEGGALRSQDLRTSADHTGFNGAILRVDPATGDALPDNPLYGGAVADDDRVIAYGLRNPYRFTVRPGTDQVWIGDVGWDHWEEIDRLGDANDSVVENFGWPCYEGVGPQPGYNAANLDICEALYNDEGAVTAPTFTYHHQAHVVPNDGCPVGSSVVSAIAFYRGGDYPRRLRGALFFADLSRGCLWVMPPGVNGEPDPSRRRLFASGVSLVDLKAGPAGDLFYVDIYGGKIRRIQYVGVPPGRRN